MLKRLLIAIGVPLSAAALVLFGADATRQPDAVSFDVGTDASANAILGRSCANCHSNRTVWPWYAHLPGVGGVVRRDVQAARAQFNLSDWASYSPDRKNEVLAEMAAMVRNRRMPPSRYTFLHPDARLSDAQIRQLTEWTTSERRRLSSAAGRDSEGP